MQSGLLRKMVHIASTGSHRPSAMETQCIYDSVSTGTYYGGVVKSFPDGEGKEEGSGLGMTGRPADYRKNITFKDVL